MEKYYVLNVDNHGFYSQSVTLKNKAGRLKQITVSHSIPNIPVGTMFKCYYESADAKPFSLAMAYSYKINGRRFVELPRRPLTMSVVRKFWNELGFFDSARLHRDIKQVLRQRKLRPSLSKATNLYMLLHGPVVR